ncbi:MAG: hypothetical protein ACT4OI_03325 [Methanobacteriota archaeon]
MKVGCGYVEKQIHGNRYLYFWSFQGRGSAVRKVERYVGRAQDPESRRRLLQDLEAYAGKAADQIRGRIEEWRRELAKP